MYGTCTIMYLYMYIDPLLLSTPMTLYTTLCYFLGSMLRCFLLDPHPHLPQHLPTNSEHHKNTHAHTCTGSLHRIAPHPPKYLPPRPRSPVLLPSGHGLLGVGAGDLRGSPAGGLWSHSASDGRLTPRGRKLPRSFRAVLEGSGTRYATEMMRVV